MSITTLDGLLAAARQIIPWTKTQSQTTVAANWSSLFDRSGMPGAGTLNVGNTANGLVPTDATTGMPLINAFGGGAAGYIANVEFGCSVACRLMLVDRLFHAGAYSYNSNVTLASQPSYSSRIPGGTDYTGLQIWIEVVTAMTGALACTVTYTNESGTAGRTTGAFSIASGAAVSRMFQMPLQAGDSGVQKIETVLGATASAGTFNILVLRPLWTGRVQIANDGDLHGPDRTGMPLIWADSALQVITAPDSTSSGVVDTLIHVVNG
jgi:hypothetical protein